MTSVYRIKGLEGPDYSPAPSKATTETAATLTSSERLDGEPRDLLAQISAALGTPRLTDVLYHFEEMDQLAALCPTFSYFHRPRRFGPIKSAPLRLTQCLFTPSADDHDLFAKSILDLALKQGREQVAIRDLLAGQKEEMPPDDCPIAMSLTGFLKRGSVWFKQHRDDILKAVLRSSEAAFIALASGAWNDQAAVLLEKVAVSPELTLQVWRSPVLKQKATEEWLTSALHPHRLHEAVALSFQTKRAREAHICLRLAAHLMSQVAGIYLGADPFNPEAEAWWKRAQTDGQALYWAGRVWKSGGHEIADFPRHDEIVALLDGYPNAQWGYHWARDVEPEEAKHFARRLWPSAWAVELIEDLRLPKEFVTELVRDFDFEEGRFWDDTLILWAAEYCTK